MTDSFYHLLEMKCGESSLLNIATVRLIIEPEVARMAANNSSNEDIAQMTDLYAKMEENSHDPKKMIRYDIDFHRSIVNAAHNPILPVIMEPLFQMMSKFISDTYEYPQSPSLALKSHYNILKSIDTKDADGSFKAMKIHMTEAKDHASEILKNKS